MKKHALVVFILSVFFVLAGVLTPVFSAKAAPKKNPVRFRVLATLPTDLPGIAKAQLIHFEMDPGAEVKNFKVVSEVLWVTEGTFTYGYGGKTVVRKKGDRWFHNAGTVLDVGNKGGSVAVIRGVQFIRVKK